VDIINCRLCEGLSPYIFSKTVLKKYKVKYYKCEKCKSLQTENPYWLEESYQDWATKFDTGIYSRVIKTFLVSFFICKIFKFKNILDFGGGDGLLCRIMRDYYLNCFSHDKFSKNLYSKAFVEKNFSTPDLITSFEAAEHFHRPSDEFSKLFNLKPKMLLLTTGIYQDQDKNWNYLEEDSGQHIFFYSKESLKFIAKKYNCNITFLECGFVLMTSVTSKLNKLMIYVLKKIIVRQKMFIFLKFALIFFKSNGHEKDYKNIKYNL
jgi:hypothetical protein